MQDELEEIFDQVPGDSLAIQEIWVIAEFNEDLLEECTIEVLSEGNTLVNAISGKLCAVVLGDPPCDLSRAFIGREVHKVYSVTHSLLNNYTTDSYVHSLAQLIDQYDPLVVLASTASDTDDYFPRLAAFLKVPVITGCVQVEFDQNMVLHFIRPSHNNKIYNRIAIPDAPCYLATLIQGVIGCPLSCGDSVPEVIVFTPSIPPNVIKTKFLSIIQGDPETIDIREANIIVSGGKGACTPTAWNLLHELAGLLGASLGGTRMALDNKYIGSDQLVGQTGKSINSNYYFAVGISGAYYHLQGIHADHLIAINSDRYAPIFGQSKLGVIGDLNQVLPALIKLLEAQRE